MSFKRVGDDKCALDNLRKRRVSDLLLEEIQDDEVSKLRNGRYLCKVCQHCPTFDTLSMFQVHKQGKKHKSSLEYQEIKDIELQQLKQKRQQELETQRKGENMSMVLGPETSPAYARPKPYDPRSKRHKAKPFDRKPVVELYDISTTSAVSYMETSVCSNSSSSSVDLSAGNKVNSLECQTYRQDKCIRESDASTSQTREEGLYARDTEVAASLPKHHRQSTELAEACKMYKQNSSNSKNDNEIVQFRNVSKLIGLDKNESVTQHYFYRKKKFEINKDIVERLAQPIQKQDFSKTWEFFKDKPISKAFVISGQSKEVTKHQTVNIKDAESEVAQSTNSCSKTSHEKNERAEKMLKAFGSGWKKDWRGQWVKDEDAEFDSDEEPPDVT